jgi:hypothetical protein
VSAGTEYARDLGKLKGVLKIIFGKLFVRGIVRRLKTKFSLAAPTVIERLSLIALGASSLLGNNNKAGGMRTAQVSDELTKYLHDFQ